MTFPSLASLVCQNGMGWNGMKLLWSFTSPFLAVSPASLPHLLSLHPSYSLLLSFLSLYLLSSCSCYHSSSFSFASTTISLLFLMKMLGELHNVIWKRAGRRKIWQYVFFSFLHKWMSKHLYILIEHWTPTMRKTKMNLNPVNTDELIEPVLMCKLDLYLLTSKMSIQEFSHLSSVSSISTPLLDHSHQHTNICLF